MLTLEDQIAISLRRISRAIDIWSQHLLRTYGLTSPQLAMLREISAGENVSPGTLSRALHISHPTVTGIVNRLEKRGLVARAYSRDDRRSVMVTVTEEGRELASKAPELLRHSFCNELRQLPLEEQEAILQTLQRVAGMINAPMVAEVPYFYADSEPSSES